MAEGIMITILGVSTVFCVLVFISLILTAFGKIFDKSKQETSEVKPIVSTIENSVVNENKNDDLELIAVITAAIASIECEKGNNISPDKLVVRSLRKVNTWNKEAIQEQHNNIF